jgi:serine/threonine protein kinase
MDRTCNWRSGALLGRGAFGEVRLGLNQDTGELMAVKQVLFDTQDPKLDEQLQKLQTELAVLKILDHENVVKYFFSEKVDRGVNIFMEYVPGGSIARVLAEFGPLDEQVVVQYTHQILLGLWYLHRNGVLHSDIKGANLLVTVEGIIKLADFGSSTMMETKACFAGQGTPVWMAPEVLRGESVGMPSDIWSLGCTVMEMLTGTTPWAHIGNPIQVIQYVGEGSVSTPVLLPQGLSSKAKAFLFDCLKFTPDDRPTAELLLTHAFFENNPSSPRNMSPTSPWSSAGEIVPEGIVEPIDNPSSPAKSESKPGSGNRLNEFMAMSAQNVPCTPESFNAHVVTSVVFGMCGNNE